MKNSLFSIRNITISLLVLLFSQIGSESKFSSDNNESVIVEVVDVGFDSNSNLPVVILQDDKILYHYVSPIRYLPCVTCIPEGYRDIIGLDIEIL